jgi:uncharacterized membrane protein YgcG
VVGWSWLVPPYSWLFDARAVEPTGAVAFDGLCLRGKCEEDPKLGYELMKLVSQVMFSRLVAARVRLLDLYGDSGVTAAHPLLSPLLADAGATVGNGGSGNGGSGNEVNGGGADGGGAGDDGDTGARAR